MTSNRNLGTKNEIANPNAQRIKHLMDRPWLFNYFKLSQLPMAFISGLKVSEFNPAHATVSVPYNIINKNPFRSTYFAVLAMAAELSTGVLTLYHTYGYAPSISMLVREMNASFSKKATGRTYFSCHDGERIHSAAQKALSSGEGQTVTLESIGRNKDGEEVARFSFTWAIKQRSK